MNSPLDSYLYRGAGALVELHETHLIEFVRVWRLARERELRLPETDDPAYASLDHLLHHVLACARGYLVWCCEKLGLPDPGIDAAPDPGELARDPERYLGHVLERWRGPFCSVPEDEFNPVYESRWGVGYCVDAMLEHALVHPMRHTWQLQQLMEEATDR